MKMQFKNLDESTGFGHLLYVEFNDRKLILLLGLPLIY